MTRRADEKDDKDDQEGKGMSTISRTTTKI